MSTPSDKQLREFMLDFFNEDELHTFCFDYFRDVRQEFGSGMSFNEKVMELIDYCWRHGVRENFIEALKLEKEIPFSKFFSQDSPPESPVPEKAIMAPSAYEPQPRNPQKIFVSHSSEDGKLAQQIAQDLQAHGYEIFVTPTSIRAGEKWVDAIMRGLDECGIFLVLLTPNAIKSGWVKQEANTAIALNNGNKARLLFLNVEDCQPPTLWQQWQYLSFRNQDYQENFANLLRELKGEPPVDPEVIDQIMAAAPLIETLNRQSAETVSVSEESLLNILGQHKDTSGYHLYPDIAPDDQAKIRNRLELLPPDEEILAYIVATMWGGVHAGLAFTPKRIVWRNDRFMSALSDYSTHGQVLYADFPESEFLERASSEIHLGEGLGFNHSGWCELTTEQILGLLNDIKGLVAGHS